MESTVKEIKYDTLNLLQFIFEITVIIGYVVAIVPGLYIITFLWVVPLTVANLVFSIIKENKTVPYTGTNVAMSILTFIPVIGYLALFAGITMSVLSALKVSKLMQITPSTSRKTSTVEVVTSKTKSTKDPNPKSDMTQKTPKDLSETK